jgi:hypothetical protein
VRKSTKTMSILTLLASIFIIVILIAPLAGLDAPYLDKTDPTPSGTVTAGNNILDVYVEDQPFYYGIGTYTIGTGLNHPNPNENVFYGAPVLPATTFSTIHVVDTMRDYATQRIYAVPDPGYSIEYLDDHNPSTFSTSTRVANFWTTIESLQIVQDVEVVGTTVTDTLVKVTVNVTNNDLFAHTVGVRYEWDLMIDGWDGAWIRPWTNAHTPGTWIDTETEWILPEFQFWETSNMPVSLFSVYGSISSVPDATPPDRLVYAHWESAFYTAYSFTPTGKVIGATEPSIGGQYDSCMLYYWEPTTISPGETKTVTAYVTTFISAITPISATVDIDPNTLNLKSYGEWITGYIELPEGYDVADIDVSSILLNDTIPAEADPICIDDYDSDGILDLMVKFDRANVISYVVANINIAKLNEEGSMIITLTVTGTLNDGTLFEGSDTIRILRPRGGARNSFLK